MDYSNRLCISYILYLLTALAGAAFTGYGTAVVSIPYMLAGIICVIFGISALIVKENKNLRTLNIIIEALRNNDYSFRLPQSSDSLNTAFNEFADLLQKEKLSAVEQEKFYELIINSMSIGVIVTDDNYNIIKCNEETLRLFNRNALTHISQLASWDRFDKILSELSPKEKRHILIKTVRKELNISVRLDLITLKSSNMRIFTLNDIHTEIDRNEFDAWVKLTRILTHEIMNGIAPISSISESLRNDKELPAHIRDGLDAISASSHSLIDFVESYRRFTRIPTPSPVLVSVKELVSQVKNLYGNVNITAHIEPENLIIYADESLILRVITNIVKNAIEAFDNRANGEIRIKAYSQENETVKIEIANNGQPIPQDEINEIFLPFFTTKEQGCGIGLSVSRRIMILAGGDLSVSSTPECKFTTTFTLTFP